MSQKGYPTGYPMQQNRQQPLGNRPAYPTQPAPGAYPTQPYHQPVYNPQYPPQPQPYPYVSPQAPYAVPGYGQPPPPYPGATPNPAVPQQQYMVQGQFDSGARFGAGASPNIPPPPPGVMPTASQMAAASGQPVVMQQPKAGWIEGARGGGYTFW